jgi:uncharacterized protein
MIEIKLFKDVDFKNSLFIEGFPGTGLVGPMALSYIIDKLKLSYVGYVESDMFPPLVSVHENKPMSPVRVYYSDKAKIATIFAEFAIPINAIYKLSEVIYDFIKDNKFSKIISISGIQSPSNAGKTVFSIASTDETLKEAVNSGLTPIADGVSVGVGALILSRATIDGLPDINILVPVESEVVNPKYAEFAINSLNKLMDLNIDVTELEKEARDVEAKIRDLLKKGKDVHDDYKKVLSDSSPSMYA